MPFDNIVRIYLKVSSLQLSLIKITIADQNAESTYTAKQRLHRRLELQAWIIHVAQE